MTGGKNNNAVTKHTAEEENATFAKLVKTTLQSKPLLTDDGDNLNVLQPPSKNHSNKI